MTKYVDASPFELFEGRLLPSDGASLAEAFYCKSGYESGKCPLPGVVPGLSSVCFQTGEPETCLLRLTASAAEEQSTTIGGIFTANDRYGEFDSLGDCF